MTPDWSMDDIPDMSGVTCIVTGANSGIGFEASKALAERGARVILACRNPERGRKAKEMIGGESFLLRLDLSDISSIRDFGRNYIREYGDLDILINNAGVMALPKRTLTVDGFETTFGVNHLGHFALTAFLIKTLMKSPKARIVNVSSQAHMMARINWDDINAEKRYSKWRQYALSKLANLFFTYELERRLKKEGSKAICLACHPGLSSTNLQKNTFFRHLNPMIAQSAYMGSLPLLYAASSFDALGGDYIGPKGPFGMWGHPARVSSSPHSHSVIDSQRMWSMSSDMCQIKFPI